jgi:hypothetical protein
MEKSKNFFEKIDFFDDRKLRLVEKDLCEKGGALCLIIFMEFCFVYSMSLWRNRCFGWTKGA